MRILSLVFAAVTLVSFSGVSYANHHNKKGEKKKDGTTEPAPAEPAPAPAPTPKAL